MKLTRALRAQIAAQAKQELPNECCGYLAGRADQVQKVFPMRNVDQSPEHFSFAADEQFDVLRRVRAEGLEILGPYHSHPETPARMSREDIRLANDYNAVYAIYSVCDDELHFFSVSEDSGGRRVVKRLDKQWEDK